MAPPYGPAFTPPPSSAEIGKEGEAEQMPRRGDFRESHNCFLLADQCSGVVTTVSALTFTGARNAPRDHLKVSPVFSCDASNPEG